MVSSYAWIGISIPNNIARMDSFPLSYFQHGVRQSTELHDSRTPRSGHVPSGSILADRSFGLLGPLI